MWVCFVVCVGLIVMEWLSPFHPPDVLMSAYGCKHFLIKADATNTKTTPPVILHVVINSPYVRDEQVSCLHLISTGEEVQVFIYSNYHAMTYSHKKLDKLN